MNSVTVVLLSCLIILCAQAKSISSSKKCKCSNGFIGRLNSGDLRKIKSQPVFHQPSSFCPQMEIIIVLENKEKCVNPESLLGKYLLIEKKRQENLAALRTTRAADQTSDSGTSAGLNTTVTTQ